MISKTPWKNKLAATGLHFQIVLLHAPACAGLLYNHLFDHQMMVGKKQNIGINLNSLQVSLWINNITTYHNIISTIAQNVHNIMCCKRCQILLLIQGFCDVRPSATSPGIGCICFDEFHERSIESDLAFAQCLHSKRQRPNGPELMRTDEMDC